MPSTSPIAQPVKQWMVAEKAVRERPDPAPLWSGLWWGAWGVAVGM